MMTGTAIVAPLTSSMLIGCSDISKTNDEANLSANDAQLKTLVENNQLTAEFFSQEQFLFISQIMDTILPATDTPSATDVKVNYMLDSMLTHVFPVNYQQQFLKKIALLEKYLAAKTFITSSALDKETALMSLENISNKSDPHYLAYIDLKQQTISYYLSAEEIAENYLNYLPIPGGWTPDVSVEELGGKVWAI